MLADMVTRGNRLADVGCDHGFLSIYLVQAGICPGALAMDVREGPLNAARRHVEEAGLAKYIELRCSDGLKKYEAGEADTLVCAGMGGRLMERILTESLEKVRRMGEMILQPQSEIAEFRIFLRKAGFAIVQEDAVFEEGKYYFAMKARSNDSVASAVTSEEQRLYDLFGEKLLRGKNPVLLQYLKQREGYLTQLEETLSTAGSEKAVLRLREVRRELSEIEGAEAYF